jgi:hypothetical protein
MIFTSKVAAHAVGCSTEKTSAGARVVVEDASHHQLGRGTLSAGHVTTDGCVMSFSVAGLTRTSKYVIRVGNLPAQSFSLEQVDGGETLRLTNNVVPVLATTTTTLPPTTTTLSPGDQIAALLDVDPGQASIYESTYDKSLVILPRMTNKGARRIKALTGVFTVIVTDVFGKTLSSRWRYDFKQGIAPGQTVAITDKFQQIGGDYVSGFWGLNRYIDEQRAIIENLGRRDASVAVTWTAYVLVLDDGTTIGEPP